MKYFNDTLEYDVWPVENNFCGLTYDEFRVLLNGFIILAYSEAKNRNLTDKQMKIRSPFHCIIGQNSSSVVVGISTDNAIKKRAICTSLNKEQNNMGIDQFEAFMEKVCEEELGYTGNTFIELDKTILKNKFIKESLQVEEKFLTCFKNKVTELENKFKENVLNQKIKNELEAALNCWELLKMSVSKFVDNLDRGTHTVEFNPIFKAKDLVVDEKLIFGILQFDDTRKEIFDELIRPKLEESFGLTVIRSGNIFDSNIDIMENIWTYINKAKIVICDLSCKNPNVYYELGIANTIGKDVIPICDEESFHEDYKDKLPFDIVLRNVLFYKNTAVGSEKFIDDLKKTVKAIIEGHPVISTN